MHVRHGRQWIKITRESCREGLHLPDRSTIRCEGEAEHARCKFCRCELVRMANVTRWRFSGQLGAESKAEERAC